MEDSLRDKEEENKRQEYIRGTKGSFNPLFKDLFFGPKDKKFIDARSVENVAVRGCNVYYWPKLDTPTRTDNITNGSIKPDLSPFVPQGRVATGAELYGEPITVGNRIDSVTREITQAWGYGDPFQFRGIASNPITAQEPNERGYIETHKLTFEVSRLMCEDKGFIPKSGDVIELSDFLHGYYDVELVKSDERTWGGNGFFSTFIITLRKNSVFEPPRKNLPREQI